MKKLFRFQQFNWALVLFFAIFLTLIVGVVPLRQGRTQTTNPWALVGKWEGPFPWPIVPIHMHVLPNGKVLAWQSAGSTNSPDDGLVGGGESRVWDPATKTFIKVPITRTEVFCSGHAFLPDGRMLVTGGHENYNARQQPTGSIQANIFDFRTNTWSAAPDMNNRRWYPTNTTLSDGNVLVISGEISDGQNNKIPQVWQTGSNTWRTLTSAQRQLPSYPWMFVAPNGTTVFNAGPNQDTQYLNTSGTGAWTPVANNKFGNRNYGFAVMYDFGKVLLVGGGGASQSGPPPTNTAEVINLKDATPQWRYTSSMANARRQINATILPNGKVLVTGGTKFRGFNNQDPAGVVLNAEMWEPQTETWFTMAPMQVPRLYHSTAVLLPDARILSGGGGQGGGGIDHYDVEIYSPPYLFNRDGSLAKRPTIISAPKSVAYNQTFFVRTPDAANITQANLVGLSSVTHGHNMNQSFSRLSFSQASGGLNIQAPVNENQTPPGHYMLFLLKNGVPSVASIIQLS